MHFAQRQARRTHPAPERRGRARPTRGRRELRCEGNGWHACYCAPVWATVASLPRTTTTTCERGAEALPLPEPPELRADAPLARRLTWAAVVKVGALSTGTADTISSFSPTLSP